MPEKKTKPVVRQLSISDLRQIFRKRIYGLPADMEEDIANHRSKYDGKEVVFGDSELGVPTCISEPPALPEHSKYAGLFETVLYITTKSGSKRTIYHQIVGRKPVKLRTKPEKKEGEEDDPEAEVVEKEFYVAVGRLAGELVLYFLPAHTKAKWPENSVFLSFTPV